MAVYNTDYLEDLNSNVITLDQDITTDGDDGRVWISYDPNTKLVTNTFWITEDRKIGKRDSSGGVSYSAEIIGNVLTKDQISLCLNKNQDKLYVMYGNPPNNIGTYLDEVLISTLAITNIVSDSTPRLTPNKCIIDNTGKLWFCGNDGVSNGQKRLYKWDLDGTNRSYVDIRGTSTQTNFCMNSNQEAFIYSSYTGDTTSNYNSIIQKIIVDGAGNLNSIEYSTNNIPDINILHAVDSFLLDDYCYFLCMNILNNNSPTIVKIPIATWNDYTTWDYTRLDNDYSVEVKVMQFFTDGVYGYFYENNGTTKTRIYRLALNDLYVEVLEDYDVPNNQFKWGSGLGTVKNISCPIGFRIGSNNCDPSGFLQSLKGATGAT